MGMTAEQAIEKLFRQRNSVGCGDLSWQDAIDIGDLIREQEYQLQQKDEQIKELKNPMNCFNGHDDWKWGWECSLEHNVPCGKCSEWETRKPAAIGAEGRGGE